VVVVFRYGESGAATAGDHEYSQLFRFESTAEFSELLHALSIPQRLKPASVWLGYGTTKEVAEKLVDDKNATTGAEARIDSGALRGAQAPLFHVAAHISEFFRKL